VGCHGGHIGITGTPKNTKVVVGGLGGVERGVWCRESKGFSGKPVHKIGRSVKGLNPVNWRETRLK
jgi:hypothetical protein